MNVDLIPLIFSICLLLRHYNVWTKYITDLEFREKNTILARLEEFRDNISKKKTI
jgi:hypothetical protein